MEFKGKITFIGKEEKVGKNEISKLDFVLEEVDAEYPNSVSISLFKERIDRIKNYKVGDIVIASLNLKAREYNKKRFTNISAWKISTEGGNSSPKSDDKKDDDLPF